MPWILTDISTPLVTRSIDGWIDKSPHLNIYVNIIFSVDLASLTVAGCFYCETLHKSKNKPKLIIDEGNKTKSEGSTQSSCSKYEYHNSIGGTNQSLIPHQTIT